MNSNQRPYIFITNDDGINAPGINFLIQQMCQLGDVLVVAPDGPRSGQSNALTVNAPLRITKVKEESGLTVFSCTGTPTDCVKLGINTAVARIPDLLVSGINHGSNAAINVIYSGTMGAVLEGCSHFIPSIGFSIDNHSMNADFSYFLPVVTKVAQNVLENGLPNGVCLNVNAPVGEIKGVKVCRQCSGHWTEEYEKCTDPHDRPYYWLTGHFENLEIGNPETDEWAVANGYASVVPVKVDMTAHEALTIINQWQF